jgi:hypothetical protein
VTVARSAFSLSTLAGGELAVPLKSLVSLAGSASVPARASDVDNRATSAFARIFSASDVDSEDTVDGPSLSPPKSSLVAAMVDSLSAVCSGLSVTTPCTAGDADVDERSAELSFGREVVSDAADRVGAAGACGVGGAAGMAVGGTGALGGGIT